MGDPQQIERLRSAYRMLLDPAMPDADHHVDLDPSDLPAFSDLAERISVHLRRNGADAVEVRLGNQVLGVSTRAIVERWSGTLTGVDQAPVSSGDHGTLPGESGQYRVVRYACPDGHDPAYEQFRIFHDARDLPTCPTHGRRMELPEWI